MAPLQTRVEGKRSCDRRINEFHSTGNAQNTIALNVDLPKGDSGQQTAYLVFYFTELFARPKLEDTRIMDIHIRQDDDVGGGRAHQMQSDNVLHDYCFTC
ncbi:unnamed protein product [Linum trigynum]|uniref:Uncharacterized protein n=1 Tax=Linum trigynum TaxID=586398 RepID=A0AAV2DN92_9ROSI